MTAALPPPTLGEILAAALTAPPVAAPPLVDDFMYRAALSLSRELSGPLGMGDAEVLDWLCTIPDDMLPLLNSPAGWSELASMIAADFGIAAASYQPTIH